MKNFLLEACVDSTISALAAEAGGAKRVELCSSLLIGGISPSRGLVSEVLKNTNLEVRVLLRPRFGDFLYNDYEISEMIEDTLMYRDMGVAGIVTGVLTKEGELDIPAMKRICSAAVGIDIALHRAFDMTINPFKTLEYAKQLGLKTILTSGQKNTAIEGKELLKELVAKSKDEIEILIGGGIKPDILKELAIYTNASSFHMSGKEVIQSKMKFRRKEVFMGIANVSEYELWRTDKNKIAEAIKILEEI